MRTRLSHTALLLILLPWTSRGQAGPVGPPTAPSESPPRASSQDASSQTATEPSGPSRREPGYPARIYADAFLVWIYRQPERDPAPLGYLRAGQNASLLQAAPVSRRGCSGGWFAIHPAGFICKDQQTSFEVTRYGQAMSELAPKDGPHPFEFALSMGTPSYRRVPSRAEAQRRERTFGEAKPRPLPPHWRGHEELVGGNASELTPLGWFLKDGGSVSRSEEPRLVRREVPFGSMLAITGAFEADGRGYLQSADGTIVPEERMRVFRHSQFSGVDLHGALQLPLAWTREKARTFRLSPDCPPPEPPPDLDATPPLPMPQKAPTNRTSECLSEQPNRTRVRELHALSGRKLTREGDVVLETTRGLWLPASALFVAERRAPPAEEQQWLHFSISQGTLTAYYEGKPVFTTLASPGIGGRPREGGDPLADRTTPLGRYRIHFKHRSDDMSPEQGERRSFWIADVPFAMYFKQPFAIHVAYWHDAFGEPMSGGCINVSPQDGKRLFDWTTPRVPEGWYGASASAELGHGTAITIER